MDMAELTRDAKATLTIILRKDGQVGVVGPLSEKMLCYGMLEIARDQIAGFKEPSAVLKPQIIPPTNLRINN